MKNLRAERAALRSGLLAMTVLLATPPASARTIEGVSLPEKDVVDGHTVILNGAALFEATFMKLDVYVVGLYLSHREHEPSRIARCTDVWRVRLTFLMDVPRSRYQSGFRDAFDRRSGRSSIDGASIERFIASLPAISRGDVHELTFRPGSGVELSVNGRTRAIIDGRGFCGLVIRGFVDPKDAPPGIAERLVAHR